jgi:hypothetical protein
MISVHLCTIEAPSARRLRRTGCGRRPQEVVAMMWQGGTRQMVEAEHLYRASWRSLPVLAFWFMNTLVFGVVRLCDRAIYWLMTWFGFAVAPARVSAIGSVGWVLVMATFLTWMFALHGVSLVLDGDGFVFQRLGSVVAGRWSDVQRIGRSRSLYSAMLGEGLILRALTPHNPQRWARWGDRWRFVSLAQFHPRWRTGAIGEDICRFAPHLLRDGEGDGR